MPTYVYTCPEHGQFEVDKPMSVASYPEMCPEGRCLLETRRVYSGQAFIMRPDGWSLRPGDRDYWNFDRQRELGQLREGGANADRKRLDASLHERPAPPKVTYTDKQMREIRNFSEIVDREIRASSDIPELVREGS